MQKYSSRSQNNPDNRFTALTMDWEAGEELPQQVKVRSEQARSIISENDSPDIPFRYSLNPYRGCTHACAYCYARPTHEYLGLGAGTDFDTQIYAKINAPELLRKKLFSPKWERDWIAFSGITDCYQPAERQLRLTRQCLQICAEAENPVSIITKSPLILRDIDVLQTLNTRTELRAIISIPFLNPEHSRHLEPFAPSTELRWKTLSQLSAAGLHTGISLGPIIPGLNDSDIPALLKRAKESGAHFAFYVMLRLPGHVQDVFMERMAKVLPQYVQKVEHHIRAVRNGNLYATDFKSRMQGSGKSAEIIDQLFKLYARKYGLLDGERLTPISPTKTPMKKSEAKNTNTKSTLVNAPFSTTKPNKPVNSFPEQISLI